MTFKNFDVAYYDYPLGEVVDMWVAKGGQPWELIEPIDGFHPNQVRCHSVLSFIRYGCLVLLSTRSNPSELDQC
jgi:hypothetical protein